MKGLIIAYSFPPNTGVGALRPAYWAKHFCEHGVEVEVVSAFDHSGAAEFRHHYVPLKSSSPLQGIIKDEGLRWRKDVLEYLKTHSLSNFDFVIITGGPFFHFSLARYFKKQGIKVFLDFRDPFSYNPRMNEKGLKKRIKQSFENHCLKYADAVITVNKECHEYIAPKNTHIARWIIPNGFNDDELPKEHKSSVEGLFYAGKFYWPPTNFFSVLAKNNYSLFHAGNKLEIDHDYLNSNGYKYLGYLSQAELYKELNNAEIGVVFTMNIPFESTTKIYDYIALNKKILVITQGKPNIGALKRELDNYPYHQWVSNDPAEIAAAIAKLKEMKVEVFDPHPFSRKHALVLLSNKIFDCFNA